MEATVGPLRGAFTGKLAFGIFLCTLEREDPGGEGEIARSVFEHTPAQNLAPIGVIGETYLGDAGAGEGRCVEITPDLLVPDLGNQLVTTIGGLQFRPLFQDLLRLFMQSGIKNHQLFIELRQSNGITKYLAGSAQLEEPPCYIDLLFDLFAIAAHGLHNFTQIMNTVGRNNILLQALLFGDRES